MNRAKRKDPNSNKLAATQAPRILSGPLKGMTLKTPSDDTTRPTAAKVRAALFNSLTGRLADAAVLDLFAGSGALGIEALSHGATISCLVESNEQTFRCLSANINDALSRFAKQGLAAPKTELLRMDADLAIQKLAASSMRFDLVFLDPPYIWGKTWLPKGLDSLQAILKADSLVIIETQESNTIFSEGGDRPAGYDILRNKLYGKTRLLSLIRL